MAKIGIQGLAASYSDAALSQMDPGATRVLYDKFSEVFRDLISGVIDKAFLPFENSTAGFIADNFQLLESSGCYATHDYIFKVEHCLLGVEEAFLDDVKVVMSHPQALLQCQRFLKDRGIESEDWFDTAGAARDVRLLGNKKKAAIASENAARVYGLKILKKAINDEPENYTRFMVIEREMKWGKRILASCAVEELRSVLLSPVKLITMLTHADEGVRWGHRVYLELDSLGTVSWESWIKDFSKLKVLGSLDGKR